MNKDWQIPRRRFLRGVGTALALPMLEAMVPATKALSAIAGEDSPAARVFPKRLGFIYVPNGVNMADWTPAAEGRRRMIGGVLSGAACVVKVR